MIRTLAILFFFSWNAITVVAQQKTLAERLGYPANTKLLIIHADDLGVSHSGNAATAAAFEKGIVSSGSIMVPCPWFPEMASYYHEHPTADLGLHLTLTSEWELYKWGPVSSRSEVPGLVNKNGFLYASVDSVLTHATADEAEREMRNQIRKALQFGIDVTHLDAHMGAAFSKKEFFLSYLKLGREFKIPVFIPRQLLESYGLKSDGEITARDVVTDHVLSAGPEDFKKGMAEFYSKGLRALPPGLTYLIIHLAYDNAEMQAVTIRHPDWGAAWRQADFDFFTSDACRKILQEEGIKVITWREIRDKLVR